jgi:cysteinyl-tRNA synthetase
MRIHLLAALAFLASLFRLASPAHAQPQTANPLASVKTFMCQLDGLDVPGAVRQLAQSDYDLLIVDPGFLSKDTPDFDAGGMVHALHQGKPGRIVLAYLNIGEAETDRVYWESTWHGPGAGQKANPPFLFAKDADDPADSFVCMFWRPRWRDLLINNRGLVSRIMAAGFDGLYLDGIDVCEQDNLSAAADKENVNAEEAMVRLISAVRAHARQINPNAVVMAENCPELVQGQPKYGQVIDGICGEQIWYTGKSDADWNDSSAGDLANRERDENSTPGLIKQYLKYRQAGLPVFTIDYCVKPENAARVYRESAAQGFIPLVTRISLSKITATPPPGLQK